MLMWNCEFKLESLSESRQKWEKILRSECETNFYNWHHIQSKNIPLGILCQKVHLGKNSSIFGTLIYDHIVWKLLKMSHLIFSILAKCLVTLLDRELCFQKLVKLPVFGIFNELLSTQNVNVASLAMLTETFSVIFKHRVSMG